MVTRICLYFFELLLFEPFRVGEVWVQIFWGQGTRARVILALRECIWNGPTVSLVLPIFYDTGSLGSPLLQVVYPSVSMVPLWVIASRFLAGNRETEVKPTTFSSLVLFDVFLSFLF